MNCGFNMTYDGYICPKCPLHVQPMTAEVSIIDLV